MLTPPNETKAGGLAQALLAQALLAPRCVAIVGGSSTN